VLRHPEFFHFTAVKWRLADATRGGLIGGMNEDGRRLRVRLFPRAETAVKQGHPWVYAESVKAQNRDGEAGELAVMYDRRDRFLAVGLYDPASPIRIRIVHSGKPAVIDRGWWLEKLRACLSRRERVLNAGTNAARIVNGESEGFPGMVADLYAETLVVKLYTAAWLPRWEEIESVLREQIAPRHLVLRLSRNIQSEAAERWALEEGFRGAPGDEVVVFLENGIRFEAAVLHGQKTGFFLDQRDNRARVESLAKGRDVLNVFSFSGAFSLYAARGGAKSVTDLDISGHALESATRNFLLNADDPRIAAVSRETIRADAFKWMEEDPRKYDMIIVDPPSLAKREMEREGALRAYQRLNARAIARLNPGGILVAASCSAHVAEEAFFELVREAAQRGGRPRREHWTSGHAEDHPAAFPEARYLKALCLEFD
jgi:23S rRNA (cytosine1962-C5)-methyltransferase